MKAQLTLADVRWDYCRGMPDRSGLARFTHLIRAPGYDPPDTTPRGFEGGGNAKRTKCHELASSGTPEQWCTRIVEHYEDGEPRTWNRTTLELVGLTADAVHGSDRPIERGLWLAVERELIAWTPSAPTFFIHARVVDWGSR